MMKALTLFQLWASLIALGEKQFETRSWETNYRGPIAIHAATKKPSSIWPDIEPIADKLREALGIIVDLDDLPRGDIIAVANLVNCHKIDSSDKADGVLVLAHLENCGCIEDKNELAFGDYTPGRFAWQLENVRRLAEPIPAKGKQRIWNWDETPHQIAIDPWVIGDTKIWTPKRVMSGQRVDPSKEDAVLGLEVVA